MNNLKENFVHFVKEVSPIELKRIMEFLQFLNEINAMTTQDTSAIKRREKATVFLLENLVDPLVKGPRSLSSGFLDLICSDYNQNPASFYQHYVKARECQIIEYVESEPLPLPPTTTQKSLQQQPRSDDTGEVRHSLPIITMPALIARPQQSPSTGEVPHLLPIITMPALIERPQQSPSVTTTTEQYDSKVFLASLNMQPSPPRLLTPIDEDTVVARQQKRKESVDNNTTTGVQKPLSMKRTCQQQQEQSTKPTSSCKICGDEPASLRYGSHELACHACVDFFRNLVLLNKDAGAHDVASQLICQNGESQCEITKANRRTCCRRCRYERCLEVGMNPELIGNLKIRSTNTMWLNNLLDQKQQQQPQLLM